jgi:hypothetical protein
MDREGWLQFERAELLDELYDGWFCEEDFSDEEVSFLPSKFDFRPALPVIGLLVLETAVNTCLFFTIINGY